MPKRPAAPTTDNDADLNNELVHWPGYLIRRAEQSHRALWTMLVGQSITSVQFGILATLDAHPDIDQRSLAKYLGLDASTLGEVCHRLHDRGLIERARSTLDGRRYVLHLTRDGRRLRHELTPRVEEVSTQLLNGLSDRQRSDLLDLLSHLVGASSAVKNGGTTNGHSGPPPA